MCHGGPELPDANSFRRSMGLESSALCHSQSPKRTAKACRPASTPTDSPHAGKRRRPLRPPRLDPNRVADQPSAQRAQRRQALWHRLVGRRRTDRRISRSCLAPSSFVCVLSPRDSSLPQAGCRRRLTRATRGRAPSALRLERKRRPFKPLTISVTMPRVRCRQPAHGPTFPPAVPIRGMTPAGHRSSFLSRPRGQRPDSHRQSVTRRRMGGSLRPRQTALSAGGRR